MIRKLIFITPLVCGACSTLQLPLDEQVNPSQEDFGSIVIGATKDVSRNLVNSEAVNKPIPQKQIVVRLDNPGVQQVSMRTQTRLPDIEFEVTPEVRREINRILSQDRKGIERCLQDRRRYFGKVAPIFRAHGLPAELISVAWIESRFQPGAGSRAGAVGLWQLMSPTAQEYGLQVGRGTDERLDPIKSSVAAARHLKDLYLRFGDWLLALAAYNAGGESIERKLEMRMASDFWTLSRKGALPSETANFVPRVIAVSLIARNPERFGFAGPSAASEETVVG